LGDAGLATEPAEGFGGSANTGTDKQTIASIAQRQAANPLNGFLNLAGIMQSPMRQTLKDTSSRGKVSFCSQNGAGAAI
jgi:hypothetical protein